MAKQQEDEKKLDKFLGASHSLFSGKLSVTQQLREVIRSLDPSNMKAVKEFRDEMPDTVKTFVKWKREAARITIATSELSDLLFMSFDGLKQDPPKYTEEEVYEDFLSTETINEIKKLESETVHFKLIDTVKLAQDAAQDFALLERHVNDVTTLYTAATSCVGVGGVLTELALMSNPVEAAVAGASALSSATIQSAVGSNVSTSIEKCKLNMEDKALLVRDICESIRRDVRLLDEMGTHASKIAKCQETMKRRGQIDNLQRDKIIISARKMKEACERYMETKKEWTETPKHTQKYALF